MNGSGALWTAAEQMAARQLTSLEQSLPYWGLAATLGIALSLTPGALAQRSRSVRVALLVTATCVAVLHAWSLRWLSDDAFISFRYADNLVRGHGLIFNLTERVEGYTNFLWTLLMAASLAVGVDPTWTATLFGIAAFACLPLLTERLVVQLYPSARARPVPFAALSTGASYCLASYGTSGLETMFATALITFAVERAVRGASLLSGTAGVLATLCHPDHGLLYAGLGAALLVARKPFRDLVRYAAPFALLFVPYFGWRYHYYGDLVPNTFHTKSGNLTYFTQGAVYLATFVIGSGTWALLVSLPVGVRAAGDRVFRGFCILGLLPYLIYVAKIGGDFMYGRLLCVALPPLLVLAELAVHHLTQRGRPILATLGVIALAITGAPNAALGARHSDWHISDEGRFYRLRSLSPLRVDSYYFQVAEDMRTYLTGLPTDPWIAFDCVGMTGYLSRLPIVDRWGLTDAHVAHQPIAGRARPGHEKRAHPGYLLSRGVHFSDVPVFPEGLARWTAAHIGRTRFFVVQHDPKVMQPLARRNGVRLPSPSRELNRVAHPLLRAEPVEQACKAWVLDEVYVQRWGTADERRRLYAAMLLQGGTGTRDEVDAIGFDGAHSHVLDTDSALSFEPDATLLERDDRLPARDLLTTTNVALQADVYGNRGSFLNTYTSAAGDRSLVRLRSQPFELRGDVMELRIGGGRDLERLHVSLRIDGEVQFRATGCFAEMLGRRLWFIKPYRGKQAVLEIQDHHAGGWGHLVVDEVRQWLPRDATTAPPPPAAP